MDPPSFLCCPLIRRWALGTIPPPAAADCAAVNTRVPGSVSAPPLGVGAAFCYVSFPSLFRRLEAALALTRGQVGPAVASCSLWDRRRQLLENLPGDMSQRVTAFGGHPAIRPLGHTPFGGRLGRGRAVLSVIGFLKAPQEGSPRPPRDRGGQGAVSPSHLAASRLSRLSNILFRLDFRANGRYRNAAAEMGGEDSAATAVPRWVPLTTHPRRGASQPRDRHGGLGCDNITDNQPGRSFVVQVPDLFYLFIFLGEMSITENAPFSRVQFGSISHIPRVTPPPLLSDSKACASPQKGTPRPLTSQSLPTPNFHLKSQP